MEAFLVSLGSVGVAEVGDRTQLLALLLAARFRQPWPIVAGIFVATLLNHAAAAWLGARLGSLLRPALLDGVVGASMILMSLWTLRPDRIEDETVPVSHGGVFIVTLLAFFVAEIGDKTQLATLALGAAYPDTAAVVAGTTTGMLLANVPVVLFGSAFAGRLPLRAMRVAAAVLFLLVGGVFVWRALQFGHNGP